MGVAPRFPMNIRRSLGRQEKGRRTDRKDSERTTYTIDTRVCGQESMLVAGAFLCRTEGVEKMIHFCGSRSGSRRSEPRFPWTALSGAG